MPEQPQLSWAERIAESKKNTFKPLDFDTRYNFVIDSTEVKNSAKVGDFIVMKTKVLDGERKNFKTNINTMPESPNPWSFLQLFEAVGLGQAWLLESNPSVHEIASALIGRSFSAEVVQGKSQREDGTYWPEYRNFNKVVANEPVAQAPAASNFGSAPAPAPQAPAQAPQPQADASPWGNPAPQNGGGMSNPFNENF